MLWRFAGADASEVSDLPAVAVEEDMASVFSAQLGCEERGRGSVSTTMERSEATADTPPRDLGEMIESELVTGGGKGLRTLRAAGAVGVVLGSGTGTGRV